MKKNHKRPAPVVPPKRFNLHFNRVETDDAHFYIQKLGGNYQKTVTRGMIKCKLAHGVGYSIIIPDLIFVGKSATHWIQPLSFHPNHLTKLNDTDIECGIQMDISCLESIAVRFSNADLITSLEDGSELYHCSILGPPNLLRYSTGTSQLVGNIPYLKLYHHTSSAASEAIKRTKYFLLSTWHIQGVAKKLTNIGYAYFTCLDHIKYDPDLHEIGMSSEGRIHLITDDFEPPKNISTQETANYPNDILELPVYRQNTDSRTHAIDVMVDSSLLAPQHLYRHAPTGRAVFYQSCMPFTYRVGMLPGEKLFFDSGTISRSKQIPHTLKSLNYVVIGDATNLDGLKAPYDEEDTQNIAKIQKIPAGSNILNFWFSNGNRDHYSLIDVEYQNFERNST